MKSAILSIRLLLLAGLLVLAACSGDESPTEPAPAPPSTDRYVDQAGGSDSNDGSSGAPWATISHAVATADSNVTLRVRPGTYDAASGETFPIVLKNGQSLVGDVANKGAGTTPTLIKGEAPYTQGTLVAGTTLIAGENTRIAGFSMDHETGPIQYACIAVDGVTMEVDHNTFLDNAYTGVNAGYGAQLDAHDNALQSSAYGLYVDGSAEVRAVDNVFETPLFGVRAFGVGVLTITNNVIHVVRGGVQGGLSGTTTIADNEFDCSEISSSAGSLLVSSGSPVIRRCTFTTSVAMRVSANGTPDAGNGSDPGGNDFSGVSGAAVVHAGDNAVTAIGNTWVHDPPQVGVDILITGSGSVVTE